LRRRFAARTAYGSHRLRARDVLDDADAVHTTDRARTASVFAIGFDCCASEGSTASRFTPTSASWHGSRVHSIAHKSWRLLRSEGP
jgi:hypothetical protein